MNLLTFYRGGVHPKDNKRSKDKNIEKLIMPNVVEISLCQHIGAPSKPVVKVGDEVKRGQIIGEPSSFISAYTHSSICGKVTKIENNLVRIENNLDESIYDYDHYEKIDTSSKSLAEIVKLAGIIGKGGAGFPTNVKLSPQEPEKIDSILINGAECEPYLTADHRLMLEKSTKLIHAIKLVQSSFPNNPKAYISVENNKADVISLYEKLLKNEDNIQILALKTRYPQGGEKQLIQAVLKREVPTNKLPFNIGVIVLNVGTLIAIDQAYTMGKPLIDTTVTISGDTVSEAKNYQIPVGASVDFIANSTGVDKDKVKKIVFGGPMMGATVSSFDTSITKTCSGILFFKDAFSVNERTCINCGMCADVCSLGLIPTKFAKFSKLENIDDAIEHNIMDCTECGCCSYICPAKIEIVQWIRLLKNKIRNSKKEGN